MNRFLFLFTILSFTACKTIIEPNQSVKKINHTNILPEDIYPYAESKERKVDLIHTKLEVDFNWEKQQLNGKAELTFKPYFYELNELDINAKYMTIKSVSLVDTNGNKSNLTFQYDSSLIHVKLPKKYTRNDTFKIAVDYIAKPNEVPIEQHEAIRDEKGLYFINPMGKIKNKPRQIWTQGETESSSCWFPTIDAPNEKTTQEIYITVADSLRTMSNGKLISSQKMKGYRTDYWTQDLPHAPYLIMMAVGDFAVIKKEWRGKPVEYWVPREDSISAEAVFGNTNEMLDFYSEKFGVEYPWDKYAQLIVSDYVSGAMENTSAVIHGKFVLRNKQQLIDENHEDVIAHELAHHWFGDLVTCESWSNLPLNESFATYAEYLWIEHKYGKMAADRHHRLDFLAYQSDTPRVKLIRFHYDNREDMFDQHSYQKGGLVLHMLRNLVGDEAFFAALKNYLTKNAFKTVEIHDLRIAFEETTGLDLNWFFNQWFLGVGHPQLDCSFEQKSDSLLLTIEQLQPENHTLFKLPLEVDIYEDGTPKTHTIFLSKRKHTYLIEVKGTVSQINVDPKKVLLAEINQPLTPEQALDLYKKSKLYADKLNVLYAVRGDTSIASYDVLELAAKDTFEHFRKIAYYFWNDIPEGKTEDHKERLMDVALKDKSSHVRSMALKIISREWGNDSNLVSLYKKALEDSSLMVKNLALTSLLSVAREDALLRAIPMEGSKDVSTILTLARIYKDVKDESKRKWFNEALTNVEDMPKSYLIHYYEEYLKTKSNEVVWKAVQKLKEEALYENNKDVRAKAGIAIHHLRLRNKERIEDIKKDIRDAKEGKSKAYDKKLLKEKYKELMAHEERMKALLEEIVQKETNNLVKKAYQDAGILEVQVEEINIEEETSEKEEKK